MKKTFVMLIVAVTSTLPWARARGANTVNADSRIQAVTVYEDRARLVRSAEITLKKGENEVVFSHLPAFVFEDSVSASGRGTIAVKITGLEIERIYLRNAAQEKVRALKEKIQELKDKDKDLTYQLAALKEQRDFIASIKMGTTDKISKELLMAEAKPEEWKKVAAFIRQALDQEAQERLQLETRQRENKKEIDAIQRELKQLCGGTDEEKTVIVGLEAAKDGKFTVDLSYVCGRAHWVPTYDARVEKKDKDVEITYKGAVIQRTGENWDNVSLSLSTARPSVGGRPEELTPWYISLYPVYEDKIALGDAYELAEAPAAPLMRQMKDKEYVEEEVEAIASTATAERSGPAVLFTIAKKESIPSDGNPHLVTIGIEKLKGDFSYTAIPKLNELAFLKASVTNTTSYPFLAGKINVFLGPDFIGSSSMKNVAESEEFDLFLGPDEGIKIERALAEEKTEKTFGIRKKGRTALRYTIDVRNLLKENAKVTVQDVMPVSQSPEIAVTLTSVKPKTVEEPEKEIPGLLEWELDLKPKEKRTIEFSLSVEYPLKQKPIGI